ncbi:DUF2726 domain-containing protein [Lonsdalea britannica]|uniref:DUF2726 domain-containing protein n=1 Tax=Lonsdalea britannica TaxID=1082704 RepID=UPI001594E5AD|nr:DUF2726 domain-containing protein [Lonsdalea britannica]
MDIKDWLLFIGGVYLVVSYTRSKGRPQAPRVRTSEPKTHQSERIVRTAANPHDQLYFVSNNDFGRRKLMNKDEYCLFKRIEKLLNDRHCYFRIFPQVSLGEILYSKDKNAYSSINSKRVDFVIINAYGDPCAVVEFQGTGHYQAMPFPAMPSKRRRAERPGLSILKFIMTTTAMISNR